MKVALLFAVILMLLLSAEAFSMLPIRGRNLQTASTTPPAGSEDSDLDDRCLLDKASGYGRRYSTRYYYDIQCGGCKSFIYYGMGGNDNRFRTQRLCESACPPRDDSTC